MNPTLPLHAQADLTPTAVVGVGARFRDRFAPHELGARDGGRHLADVPLRPGAVNLRDALLLVLLAALFAAAFPLMRIAAPAFGPALLGPALIERIPPEELRRPGTSPWYGAEYALDDLIVYAFYGHKREHAAQIKLHRRRLEERAAEAAD